jgi:hypothetical protein
VTVMVLSKVVGSSRGAATQVAGSLGSAPASHLRHPDELGDAGIAADARAGEAAAESHARAL